MACSCKCVDFIKLNCLWTGFFSKFYGIKCLWSILDLQYIHSLVKIVRLTAKFVPNWSIHSSITPRLWMKEELCQNIQIKHHLPYMYKWSKTPEAYENFRKKWNLLCKRIKYPKSWCILYVRKPIQATRSVHQWDMKSIAVHHLEPYGNNVSPVCIASPPFASHLDLVQKY